MKDQNKLFVEIVNMLEEDDNGLMWPVFLSDQGGCYYFIMTKKDFGKQSGEKVIIRLEKENWRTRKYYRDLDGNSWIKLNPIVVRMK